MTPIFELSLKREGISATATLEDGEFVVQKGSFGLGSVHLTPGVSSSGKFNPMIWRQADPATCRGVAVGDAIRRALMVL